jgi:hypothetical protein
MSREAYESDAVEIGLLAGSVVLLTPAYELDGVEILEYQAEQAARIARRVPLGFRAGMASSPPGAGAFPVVGHLTPKGA